MATTYLLADTGMWGSFVVKGGPWVQNVLRRELLFQAVDYLLAHSLSKAKGSIAEEKCITRQSACVSIIRQQESTCMWS